MSKRQTRLIAAMKASGKIMEEYKFILVARRGDVTMCWGLSPSRETKAVTQNGRLVVRLCWGCSQGCKEETEVAHSLYPSVCENASGENPKELFFRPKRTRFVL